jgi:hypothetical protein
MVFEGRLHLHQLKLRLPQFLWSQNNQVAAKGDSAQLAATLAAVVLSQCEAESRRFQFPVLSMRLKSIRPVRLRPAFKAEMKPAVQTTLMGLPLQRFNRGTQPSCGARRKTS